MTETKTHWKKLRNPLYLGSHDFQPNEERIVTVKAVQVEKVNGTDGSVSDCTTVHLVDSKPFILNSTNAKQLAKIFDTPYIEEWAGKSFKLVIKTIRAFGETVDALRVKNEKIAKQLPPLTIGSKAFIACVEKYKSDPSVLDKIKQNYSVSNETLEALTNGTV